MSSATGRSAIELARAPDALQDCEPLLSAADVAHMLGVRLKRVYELGIPCVHLSARTLRWRASAVRTWIAEREEGRAA